MGHNVFISHSSKDKAAADAVCAALEADGVRCWIAPRDIKPGEVWAASILHGIAESRMMVLVFSGHTNSSLEILELDFLQYCGKDGARLEEGGIGRRSVAAASCR